MDGEVTSVGGEVTAMKQMLGMFWIMAFGAGMARADGPQFEVVETVKVWEPVMMMNSIVRFRDHWYTACIEKRGHSRGEGALRILRSADGRKWEPVYRYYIENLDCGELAISITPDDRLMLYAYARAARAEEGQPELLANTPEKLATIRAAMGGSDRYAHVAVFSADGTTWSDFAFLKIAGSPPTSPMPMWTPFNITWFKGKGYAIGRDMTLYTTTDGLTYTALSSKRDWTYGPERKPVRDLNDAHFCNNESTIQFFPDGEMVVFCRGGTLGRSKPPYTHWTIYEKTVAKIHSFPGPNLILLPNGTILAGARAREGSDGGSTGLYQFDTKAETWRYLGLVPPKGGTTCYPGFYWNDEEGLLWVIHNAVVYEGYLTKIRLPGLAAGAARGRVSPAQK